jgi:hypothetical protein
MLVEPSNRDRDNSGSNCAFLAVSPLSDMVVVRKIQSERSVMLGASVK